MNRQLKFRVWNSTYQEMLYPSSPTKNGDYEEKLYLQLDGQLMGDFKHTGLINCSEHYVIQQFTGMLDNNGKEIYEGDIVRRKNDKLIFEVVYSDNEAAYLLIDQEGDSAYLPDFDVEVIGNIFEG